MRIAIVRRINGRQRIVRRKILIDASRSEIFSNVLDRIAERFGDTARSAIRVKQLRPIGDGPQCEKRLNARHRLPPRSVVRDEREIAQSKRLTESFIIREEKRLVLHYRTTHRRAKHVALKMRNVAVVEKVPRVERAV